MVFAPLPTRKSCGMSDFKKNKYGFSQSRQETEIRLSYLISSSDFFVPIHCRCRSLLFRLTTNNDTNRLSRNPLDDGSANCRDSVPVNTQQSLQTISISLAGFEPAIPASERPQTNALDRAITRIG